MSRQNLRSSKLGEKIVSGESSQEEMDVQELDQTMVEKPTIREMRNLPGAGGLTMETLSQETNTSDSMSRKLDELEKRVKKLLETERKYREKQEIEKEKKLQVKLNQMETGINRSIEVTNGITHSMEERQQRIDAQFNRLEAQQTRIIERINAGEGLREESRSSNYGSNIKHILPEFRGETSPIRYINELKQYWEAVEPRENETHYLIERSLRGPPGDWWQIVKSEVRNLQTFLQKFTQRYWNEQNQHEIRRKLEFGHHCPEKNTSRAEYAIRLCAEAIELNPPMTSIEIIQKLARHFNEEIKYAVIGRGISRIDELIDLLENFDKIGPSNSGRGDSKESRSRRIEEQQWNRSENNIQHPSSWRGNSGTNNIMRSDQTSRPPWHNINNNPGNRTNIMQRHHQQGAGAQPRSEESKNWRGNNQHPPYRVRNIGLDEGIQEENMVEDREQVLTDMGNEEVPRS